MKKLFMTSLTIAFLTYIFFSFFPPLIIIFADFGKMVMEPVFYIITAVIPAISPPIDMFSSAFVLLSFFCVALGAVVSGTLFCIFMKKDESLVEMYKKWLVYFLAIPLGSSLAAICPSLLQEKFSLVPKVAALSFFATFFGILIVFFFTNTILLAIMLGGAAISRFRRRN